LNSHNYLLNLQRGTVYPKYSKIIKYLNKIFKIIVSKSKLIFGGNMKYLQSSILFFFLAILIFVSFFCGSSAFEDGKAAFDKGDYNMALKYFIEAKKEQADNQEISEKIAICYMMKGKELFEKTNNVKTFQGNFTKGEEFIPDVPSVEFEKTYSDLLLVLGQAYNNAKPENDIQREDYLIKSISVLEGALVYNHENKNAEDLLSSIKSENFLSMLEKGKSLFTQAKKQRNNDLYFAAEYYFNKANNFDPENKDAKKCLSETREKTLNVADVKQDLALAIVDRNFSKGSYLIDVEIVNNTTESTTVKPDNFNLVDKNGNSYHLDRDLMAQLKDKSLTEKNVSDRKSTGGILAFKMKTEQAIDFLEYKLSDQKSVKKYFP